MSSLAIIDLGSNSTRLLIPPGERRERITGLGRSGFGNTGLERTLAAVDEYLELAAERNVERVAAVATSAVRDAGPAAAALAAELERRRVELYVLTGEEEAALTFAGATLDLRPGERATVVDVGGGSTEISSGRAGWNPEWLRSFDLGSVRCTRDYERFTRADRKRLAALALETFHLPPAARADRLIAAGGTATTLAGLLSGGDSLEIHRIGLNDVETLLDELELLSPGDISSRYAVPLLRAQVFRAGLTLLASAVRACGHESFTVSKKDLLDGTAHDLKNGVGILSQR